MKISLSVQKAGDKIEVNVTFPENYGAADLAGREAIFDVKIHEIHEATDAVVDDEFAKTLGFDDEQGTYVMRLSISLTATTSNQTRLKMKRQLLDILDDKHDFDIPEGMVTTRIRRHYATN